MLFCGAARAVSILCFIMLAAAPGLAAEAPTPTASVSPAPLASPSAPPRFPANTIPEKFSVHAQTTNIQQYHGGFPAAYDGPQSITSHADTAKTFDVTLYLGARLGKHTEAYINPELDQGFGLGNPPTAPGLIYNGTFGAAGFPSAEAYKVGRDASYGRIHRAFVRHTFDLGGGEPQAIAPDINQLAGSMDPRHVIVTAGKFGAVDVFDNNPYAHDPRNDFLNWSIVDMGAFDYPADAWGYTYGLSAEATSARNTLRAGIFQLSVLPNQIGIEHQPFRQYGALLEFERRTSLFCGHPGAIKTLIYHDTGYFGAYADAVAAVAATKAPAQTADVRQHKHTKVGGGLNLAQEIAPYVGVFARVSAMNGTWETVDFTDIDRSFSAGISLNGGLYHRPGDTFGFGGAFNGLSEPAKRYFGAGGVGVLAGDGNLTYGGERILETYYKAQLTKNLAATLDYQRIANPAYNTVRGPISVSGVRFRANI